MAIEKSTDLENGFTATFWKIYEVSRITPIEGGLSARVEYCLYATASAYASGLASVQRMRSIPVEVAGTNPSLSDFEAAADAELLRPTVEEVRAVQEVKAVAAKPAVPAADGKPGRAAVDAVVAVEGVQGVMAVIGGKLEGGEIV